MSKLIVAVLGLLLLVPKAHADRLAIAEPYFQGTDGQAVGREIAKIVREELKEQHQVVDVAPGALQAKPCQGGDCAEAVKNAADAVAVVVIRVARGAGGPGPATSFQIGLQLAVGVEYTEGALLSDGPLKDITLKAVRGVMRQYGMGVGPWLEVSGSPKGAAIYVDDRWVSTLPRALTVGTGQHRVRVEARGYAPSTRVVTLLSPTERQKLDFRLQPARVEPVVVGPRTPTNGATPAVTAPPVSDPPNSGKVLFWSGVGITAAGFTMLGFGIRAKVRDGSCDESGAGGVCHERFEFDAGSKALLGLGISATAVGAVLGAWGLHKWERFNAGLSAGPKAVGLVVGRTL